MRSGPAAGKPWRSVEGDRTICGRGASRCSGAGADEAVCVGEACPDGISTFQESMGADAKLRCFAAPQPFGGKFDKGDLFVRVLCSTFHEHADKPALYPNHGGVRAGTVPQALCMWP